MKSQPILPACSPIKSFSGGRQGSAINRVSGSGIGRLGGIAWQNSGSRVALCVSGDTYNLTHTDKAGTTVEQEGEPDRGGTLYTQLVVVVVVVEASILPD